MDSNSSSNLDIRKMAMGVQDHNPSHSIPFSRPSTPSGGVQPVTIGFCGLGAMGFLMARNLANYQHAHRGNSSPSPVLVYNRTRAKSEQLLKELGDDKIKISDSAMQLAKDCDVVITSLGSDAAVKSIYAQFKQALSDVSDSKQRIFVESSTCFPSVAGELDQLITGPHTRLITCPVFGAPAAADKAQLILVMSGDYRSKKEVAYLLVPAVGKKVIDLGGNLEKAPTMKLIGNSLILGFMEVMAESITLGEKSGVGASSVHNLIQDLFPTPIILNYANKMTNDTFDGAKGFSIDGGLKDASHVRQLATQNNGVVPAVDAAHRNMLTARAIHSNAKAAAVAQYEVLDWSALIAGPRVASGLDGLNSGKHLKVERED